MPKEFHRQVVEAFEKLFRKGPESETKLEGQVFSKAKLVNLKDEPGLQTGVYIKLYPGKPGNGISMKEEEVSESILPHGYYLDPYGSNYRIMHKRDGFIRPVGKISFAREEILIKATHVKRLSKLLFPQTE